jgi:hypothetical protein
MKIPTTLKHKPVIVLKTMKTLTAGMLISQMLKAFP